MKFDSVPQHFSRTKEHISKITEEKCNGNHDSKTLMFDDAARSESKCSYITLAECLSREKALESFHEAYDVRIGGCLTDNHKGNVDAPTYVPLPEFETVGEKNVHIEQTIVQIEHPKVICFEKEEKQVVKDIGIDVGVCSSGSPFLHKDVKGVKFLTVYSNAEEFGSAPDEDFTKYVEINVDSSSTEDKVSENPHNEVGSQILPSGQDVGRDLLEVPSSDTECAYQEKMPAVRDNIQLLNSWSDADRAGHQARSSINDNIQPLELSSSGVHDFLNQPTRPQEVYCLKPLYSRGLHSQHSGALEPENSISPGGCGGEPGYADRPHDASSVDKQNVGGIATGDADVHLTMINKQTKVVTGLQQRDRAMIGESTYDNLPPASQNPFHYVQTDASVYGPHALSDRISYTGHPPYSGSISLRSDSSTTSTRSFAFPILPTEWNSSPVKMAKADRRHYRKYRGWTSRILCCRF